MRSRIGLFLFFITSVGHADQTYDLHIHYKTVYFAGKPREAIAVNNQIPAPALHFKEGENATIYVHNHLDRDTAVHWHGIILPWQMDGVEGVTQAGIKPGTTFTYHFKINQSGTYWYHAHAQLQEQDGLYGAFIIDPKVPEPYSYNKEFAIVLSDWSNVLGSQVLANLKKAGDYYSPWFPLQASLQKFLCDFHQANETQRKAIVADYKMMQEMRMSIYDLSDVAYDAYLLNGHPHQDPWQGLVQVGDTVRLRFVGAAASTIYRVKIPGTIMQIVQVQGNDVQPYEVEDFYLSPGETIDVLVHIKSNAPKLIYAESLDTRGKVFGALVTQRQPIYGSQITPFPEPEPVTREMMANMMPSGHQEHNTHQGHSQHQSASNIHSEHQMDMPTEATIVGDTLAHEPIHATTQGIRYQNLMARYPTNNPNKPVDATIRMELFGYMEQFIWFINGIQEHHAPPIILEPGKRYRIIFTNNSMMRHPMHMHGHWFILRNGHQEYDPLLHVIEVPPGATAVADVDADASGQWFFHCHHLYHMMTGMGRIFQYSTLIDIVKHKAQPESIMQAQPYRNRPIVRMDEVLPIMDNLVEHPQPHPHGFYFANDLSVGFDIEKDIQKITFNGLYGPDYHKLQLFVNDAEIKSGEIENADLDFFYWYLISQFWSIKGGLNYFYEPGGPYLQPGLGMEGMMPYFIETNLRAYYHHGLKLDLEFERDTQITNNFFINTEVRAIIATDTVWEDEIGSGLNEMQYSIKPFYRVKPGISVFIEYEYERAYDKLRAIRFENGEPIKENTLTLGLDFLF